VLIDNANDQILRLPIGVGSAELFEDLLWVCDKKALRHWPADLEGLRCLANYLGVPEQVQHTLSTWHPTSLCARMEALDKVSPLWASLTVNPPEMLVDVDALAVLQFEPLQGRDSRWLFHKRAAAHPCHSSVLRPDPVQYALASLPEPVVQLLHKHDKLMLAGGSALFVASDCVEPGADYDLFLWGCSRSQAEAVKQDLLEMPGVHAVTESSAAVTVVWGEDETCVIQLITWLFDSPRHVLESFDVWPSQVGLGRFGDAHGKLQLRATMGWLQSMKHMTFWVDLGRWSDASVPRILKYYAKGFDVVIPGLNRSAFRSRNPINFPKQRGISNLFKVEAHVLQRLRMGSMARPSCMTGGAHHGHEQRRPTYPELHSSLRHLCGSTLRESAYAELIPTSVMCFVLQILHNAGHKWLHLTLPPQRKPLQQRQQQQQHSWRTAPKTGGLFPSSPYCDKAFDFHVLTGANDFV
jgi:hypothetical protein